MINSSKLEQLKQPEELLTQHSTQHLFMTDFRFTWHFLKQRCASPGYLSNLRQNSGQKPASVRVQSPVCERFSGWGSRTTAPGLPTAPPRCHCPPDRRPPRCLPCRPRPALRWRPSDSPPSPSSAFPLRTSGRWDPGFREGNGLVFIKTVLLNTVYSR